MTAAMSRPSMMLFALLAIAAVITALGLVSGPLPRIDVPIAQHALDRHGADALTAQQCLDGRQGYIFINPTTNRRAVVCWLEDKWGFVILDQAGDEITSWISNKYKSLFDVMKYMARQGYR